MIYAVSRRESKLISYLAIKAKLYFQNRLTLLKLIREFIEKQKFEFSL